MTVSRPLFSIIVPTYSRPDFLPDAVGSVLSQTIDDLECIVVDDAGPVPASLPDHPRLRVIRRAQNGGEPAARNTGLEAARGRYVTFLDDDDLFTEDRLELALEGFERASLALCFRGGIDGRGGGNRVLEGNVYNSLFDTMTPQMGQVAVELERARPFDVNFEALTDVDWWMRTAGDIEVATTRRVGLRYRTHSGPRNRNGIAARISGSLLLLQTYADYFAARPRAAAFRWKRIGIMANSLGDRSLARLALRRSLQLRFEPATVKHYLNSSRPSSERVEIPESLVGVLPSGGERVPA